MGGSQRRIDLPDKVVQLRGGVALLTLKEFDAAGERLGGRQHRAGGGFPVGGRQASGQLFNQSGDAVAAEALAQLGGRINQQGAGKQ